MDQSKLAAEPNKISACEAFACCENAVEEIKVDVGKLGYIKLSVCGKCKDKFLAIPVETSELVGSSAQDEFVEVDK